MKEETRLIANRLSEEIRRLSAHVSCIENKSAFQIQINGCDFHVVLDALKTRVSRAKEEFESL